LLRSLGGEAARQRYGCTTVVPEEDAPALVEDGTGDQLDALLCAVQAAWAYTKRQFNYGIPADADSSEGWIVDPATFGLAGPLLA